VDIDGVRRKNPGVLQAGESRRKLVQKLRSAYVRGLLSDDTYALRLGQVFHDRVIDPSPLVDDLCFRGPEEPGLRDRLVSAMHTLVGKLERGPARRYPLLALDWSGEQPELLVGRHHTCDVVIPDLTVSRRHARLVFRDGRWILRDLESKNGTTVNGLRVGRCEIRPGDRVLLGDHQLLVD
jgi:hypothetical protein